MKKENPGALKILRDNLFMIVFLVSALMTLIVAYNTLVNMNSTISNLDSAKNNINTTAELLTSNYEMRLFSTAALAQNLLTLDEIGTLEAAPESPISKEEWFTDYTFTALRQRLQGFANDHGLKYIYYYFRIDNMFQPLIDNDKNRENAYTPASDLIKIEDEARIAWNDNRIVVAGVGGNFVDTEGLMTAYAPINNENGDVVALVGVDMLDEQLYVLRDQIKFLGTQTELINARMTTLFAGMAAALALLVTGGILNFMTNRKRTGILKAALAQAESASNAKSDFLANMSHEMRTPLNAVIGMTVIAKESDDPERKEYCLSKIAEASTHLLGVINDVLDYSKIEANKFELICSGFDFQNMMNKVCDVFSFKVDEKKQVFSANNDWTIPRILIGDEQHLSQVITNLLSNAIKFTPDGGEITITTRLEAQTDEFTTVYFEISDTGIGIPEEQKWRMFKSFEQADNTITKRFGGTGLGLSISQSIVELMGGKIEFDSEEGKGSRFYFTIPFRREDPDESSKGPESGRSGGPDEAKVYDFSGKRALIVDDVEINTEIVIALLEGTKILYDTAENGRAALNMYTQDPERYDVILMDIQMPEMDGYEAARRIRALETPPAKSVPIIAMTANAFREDIEKALAAGMDAHIAKPVDHGEMLEKLDEFLFKTVL